MDEAKIQEMFDKEDGYWWFAARRSMVLSILKKYVKRGSSLLDAGCGTGLLTKTVDHIYTVTATDNSKKSLALTKKRKPKAKVLFANLEEPLPFPKESFDAVTLLDVLEHIEDKVSLKSLRAVMKKRGVLIITVPAYPWLFSYWDILHQHKRRYTKTSLVSVLEKSGFLVEHISYFNTLFFPFFLFIRLVKSFITEKERHSDCYEMPRRANSLMLKIFEKETQLAVTHSIPFGLSILVIAKKK